MLTSRELALLSGKTIRELRLEVKLLEGEMAMCHNPYRRRWIESRLAHIVNIVNTKLSET